MSLRDFSDHAPRTPFAAPALADPAMDGIEQLPEIDDLELCVSQYNVDQATVVRHVPDWPLD